MEDCTIAKTVQRSLNDSPSPILTAAAFPLPISLVSCGNTCFEYYRAYDHVKQQRRQVAINCMYIQALTRTSSLTRVRTISCYLLQSSSAISRI